MSDPYPMLRLAELIEAAKDAIGAAIEHAERLEGAEGIGRDLGIERLNQELMELAMRLSPGLIFKEAAARQAIKADRDRFEADTRRWDALAAGGV